MFQRIPVSEARHKFRDVVSRAEFGNENIVLTFRGKDVAAIVPMTSVDLKDLGPEKKQPATAKVGRKARVKSA